MAKILDHADVQAALASADGWTLDADGALYSSVSFASAAAALGFVAAVGALAEKLDHHPELAWVYRTVSLRLRTHDAGDRVTDRDVSLMRAIAQLPR